MICLYIYQLTFFFFFYTTIGVRARLPKHYKVRYVENHMKIPKPVHYIRDERRWKLDEWGQRSVVKAII